MAIIASACLCCSGLGDFQEHTSVSDDVAEMTLRSKSWSAPEEVQDEDDDKKAAPTLLGSVARQPAFDAKVSPKSVRFDRSVNVGSLHPLTKAAALGRYAAAHRELAVLRESSGDPCEFLSGAAMERVTRIGAKFNEARRMFRLRPEDMAVHEENKNLKLTWGLKLNGDILQFVTVTEFDADFLNVVGLDLEAGIEGKVSQDEITQELLSQPHAHDASWRKRMVKFGVGTRSDDIVMVSSIDALDEDLKAVCSLKYTLDDSATTDPYGTPIPAADPGHIRTPYSMTAVALTPLGLGGDKLRGVRKFKCIEAKLEGSVARILSITPNFMMKNMCRESIEVEAKLTSQMLRNMEAFGKTVSLRPRSEFIEQVRRHVDGPRKAKKPATWHPGDKERQKVRSLANCR